MKRQYLIFAVLVVALSLSGCSVTETGNPLEAETGTESMEESEASETVEQSSQSEAEETSLTEITAESNQLFGAIVDEIDSIVLKEHIFTESDDYVIVVKEITDENEITKVLSFFNGWVAEENIGVGIDSIASHHICFGDALTFEYFYDEDREDDLSYRLIRVYDSGDNLPEIFKTEHYYVVPEEFAEYIDRIILSHSYFENIE